MSCMRKTLRSSQLIYFNLSPIPLNGSASVTNITYTATYNLSEKSNTLLTACTLIENVQNDIMKSPAKPYNETIADSYSDLKDGKRLPWTAHLLSAFLWLAFLGVSYSVSKKRQYNTIITFVKKKSKTSNNLHRWKQTSSTARHNLQKRYPLLKPKNSIRSTMMA